MGKIPLRPHNFGNSSATNVRNYEQKGNKFSLCPRRLADKLIGHQAVKHGKKFAADN
jgi:hypothetical protein